MPKISVATVRLKSFSPYSQSRYHEAPKLQGELSEAYDKRTSHCHLHVDGVDLSKLTAEQLKAKKLPVIIPHDSLAQCWASAARYSKKQIPGQGKATWTAKFLAGIQVHPPVVLNVTTADAIYQDIYCNADGVRGSGKRVMRRFPVFTSWETVFQVNILDPIITRDVFKEFVELGGMFVGIGRWRPEKGGSNGRYGVADLKWEDNREFITV